MNENQNNNNLKWTPPHVQIEVVKTGDMPGDKVKIDESHIKRANIIFPYLLEKLQSNDQQRFVISVYGGSGVGKSEIGSLLAYYCELEGSPAYVLSGDNYPHRIPEANDKERILTFRNAGLAAIIKEKAFSNDWIKDLHKLWPSMKDFESVNKSDKKLNWQNIYFQTGSKALNKYLSSEKEIDFEMINYIIKSFKKNDKTLVLKRMGRVENDINFEKVNFENIQVLIVEWTHGNSPLLSGIDFPVFLYSTPEETLAHRLSRGRDKGTDSSFINLVLRIEQDTISNQANKAKLIVSKDAEILSFEEFQKRERNRF